ncbi:hypothetical protein BG006_011156 [Podila minutissima]|uniref:Leucine-rich repeat-containing protein n=1 Tax=Podila minutissima TaxID=64525 RepID=A0A9P5SF41_9FUNG|nr:hypothetical protein BG006_011156 [Podila minutissima]
MEDTQGRMIAQLASSRGDCEFPGNRTHDVLEADADPTLGQRQQDLDDLVDIQFMFCDRDHIFSSLSDYSASFLDMAAQQHPSVLTLFTLDIPRVSRVGLTLVRNILGRSSLEHLHILCTPFNSIMFESIAQVLGLVPWSTLKSLVLSGNNIYESIRQWLLPVVAPQLIHLLIQGTGSTKQELSHSSVLFLHKLIYTSPLQECHFKNIDMKVKRDWELIRAEEVEP